MLESLFCKYMYWVSRLYHVRDHVSLWLLGFVIGIWLRFGCVWWVYDVPDNLLRRGGLLQAIGSGLWPVMVLVSEVVQTFILADFCYYYIKSYASGIDLVQLPAGIV